MSSVCHSCNNVCLLYLQRCVYIMFASRNCILSDLNIWLVHWQLENENQALEESVQVASGKFLLFTYLIFVQK